jgi:NADPH-dependent 2,4-dienoyl-CoA reductase/sulfur reductase-like enzyme
MKVAVIGCTHAGTAAIVNTVSFHPEAQITVYERNDNISFLSCGIALYVGGVVEDAKGLFYSSPEALAEKGVTTKMQHDVIDVDFEKKELTVKNLQTGETFKDTYDKLIITSGSWPITPPIEGIKLDNILLSKNYNHANEIIAKEKNVKNVVVIGAGYIGVELVEAFEENGKNVTLIDSMDRILNKYLDEEFTAPTQASLEAHGIKLALNQTVNKFEGEDGKVTRVITDKGSYEADLVILCIGFRPSTELFAGKLNMMPNGAIIVDEYMQTSVKDVFAAGDCCGVKYNPTGEQVYIPLATNAIRMGLLVAKNLKTPTMKHLGTQATSAIKIYENHIAASGMTEEAVKDAGIAYKAVLVRDAYRPEFMPTSEEALLKVVYREDNREILGAQIYSTVNLAQMMNTMSVVIQNKMTIDELALVDFFFLPHYDKPWSILNIAGIQAQSQL